VTALVVMIAPPGAGKSTWVKDRFTPNQTINLDELRGRLSDDPHAQDVTTEAVTIQDLLLAGRCRRRLLTVVDATNIRPDVRSRLLGYAYSNTMLPVAVVLDVPLETCLARNAARPRPVPEEVIRRMWAELTETVGSTGGVDGFGQTVRFDPDGYLLEVVGRGASGLDNAPWLP
jgi:protein phosphatase